MSVAFYIVTKEDMPDFDTFVNGKAIGRLDDAVIEKLCDDASVPSLLGFISQNPDELEAFFGDEDIEPDGLGELPAEEWFTPDQGLTTIRGLIVHLRGNPGAVKNSALIIEDLTEYESVLLKLAERNIAWHFAVDF